jgi:hypothetical protein
MEAAVLVVAALGLVALAQVFAIVGRRPEHGWMTRAGVAPLIGGIACFVAAVILTISTPSN